MSSKFHIGDTVNFYPSEGDLEADNAIEEYLVKGFVPDAPLLSREGRIVTIGPCFAQAVGRHLLDQGYRVTSQKDTISYIGRFGDKIGNTFAIRGQLEWAWTGTAPAADLWHGYEAERLPPSEDVRLRTRHLLDGAEAIILTLGNAEIWQDEPTGGVFWGAVPADQFDAARHRFRVSTYQENLSNLMEIYRLIRRNRPQATIVMSLGAVPPPATFRDVACLSASTSSKSMLRSALDEFFRVVAPRDPNFHYFPSYDIARYAFAQPLTADRRRLRPEVVGFIALLFEHYYAEPRLGYDALRSMFHSARRGEGPSADPADQAPHAPRQAQNPRDGRDKADRAMKRQRRANKAAEPSP
jgi:hypothetical protein